ncbi:MAG TPA: hypothetical protein VFZ40_09510 [Pyrinomonadaceae bacterium]
MIAFEVFLNGSKQCVAGVDGLGVLTAIVSSVYRAPNADANEDMSQPIRELSLEVGGLRSAQGVHASWLNRALVVGDVLTIAVKELASVDEPTATVPRESAEVAREAKRRYYEQLKKEFED